MYQKNPCRALLCFFLSFLACAFGAVDSKDWLSGDAVGSASGSSGAEKSLGSEALKELVSKLDTIGAREDRLRYGALQATGHPCPRSAAEGANSCPNLLDANLKICLMTSSPSSFSRWLLEFP